MQSNLISWLISTGLDEQRAELYLAALSKGEATAAELADAMKMRRTAMYDNLRVLESRGYVQSIKRGKRIIYIALHPKELKKKFEALGNQLRDLLPDFLSLYAGKTGTPSMQVFQGPQAAREVYEDILSTAKDEYVYLSPPELTLQTVDQLFMKKWVERRVKNGLHSRSLRVQGKNTLDPIYTKETEFGRQIRYLPAYVQLKAAIYLYGNNVAFISTQNEGVAFILHSPDLAFSLKQVFEFLWGISVRS